MPGRFDDEPPEDLPEFDWIQYEKELKARDYSWPLPKDYVNRESEAGRKKMARAIDLAIKAVEQCLPLIECTGCEQYFTHLCSTCACCAYCCPCDPWEAA